MKSFQNNILPFDGEVLYLPEELVFSKEDILNEVQWRDDKIKMFGKTFEQARKVAWHGDAGVKYTYSKIKMISPGWTPHLELIKKKIEKITHAQFNSVLVNYYRDGEDYMGPHSDNEKELGSEPIIVSVSLGQSRDFVFKHKTKNERIVLPLNHGDILIMQGKTQDYWNHSLPKRKNIGGARLNLTYRFIYPE